MTVEPSAMASLPTAMIVQVRAVPLKRNRKTVNNRSTFNLIFMLYPLKSFGFGAVHTYPIGPDN